MNLFRTKLYQKIELFSKPKKDGKYCAICLKDLRRNVYNSPKFVGILCLNCKRRIDIRKDYKNFEEFERTKYRFVGYPNL